MITNSNSKVCDEWLKILNCKCLKKLGLSVIVVLTFTTLKLHLQSFKRNASQLSNKITVEIKNKTDFLDKDCQCQEIKGNLKKMPSPLST